MSFSRTAPDAPNRLAAPAVAGSTGDGNPRVDAPEDLAVEPTDWGKIGALAAGIVIGAVIGAGSALLLAPQSGRDTRRSMRRLAGRGRKRVEAALDDLGDDLYWKGRAGRKRLRRGATRGSWFVEDLIDGVFESLGRRRPDGDSPVLDDDNRPRRVIVEED